MLLRDASPHRHHRCSRYFCDSVCEGFLSELLARVLAEKRASATGWYVEPHDVQRALAGMLGAQEARAADDAAKAAHG